MARTVVPWSGPVRIPRLRPAGACARAPGQVTGSVSQYQRVELSLVRIATHRGSTCQSPNRHGGPPLRAGRGAWRRAGTHGNPSCGSRPVSGGLAQPTAHGGGREPQQPLANADRRAIADRVKWVIFRFTVGSDGVVSGHRASCSPRAPWGHGTGIPFEQNVVRIPIRLGHPSVVAARRERAGSRVPPTVRVGMDALHRQFKGRKPAEATPGRSAHPEPHHVLGDPPRFVCAHIVPQLPANLSDGVILLMPLAAPPP
jgi:hypothetical protein